jgi:hypothetical protein
MNHQTDREGTDENLAEEAEQYRDSVNKGGHGAHKPCEKFPIEEAEAKEQQSLEENTAPNRKVSGTGRKSAQLIPPATL